MTIKSLQRNELLAKRRSITAQERQRWDAQIGQHVLAWCRNYLQTQPHHQERVCVGIYSPIQAEPELHAILPALTALGLELALPTAPIKDQALVFISWKPGDELMKDRYGVPIPSNAGNIVHPDILFIPCVGYNQRGFRLGYGGGYYDRTLALHPHTIAVGIAYKNCLCNLVESKYDIAMKCIITNDE